MRFSRIAAVGLLAAVALGGCGGKSGGSAGGGGSRNSGSASQSSNCIILQNGNQLCGQAGVAYCRRFESSPPDQKTAQACAAVDPTGNYQYLPPASQSHGKVPCDAYPTQQEQNQCMKSALAGTGISP